MTVLQIAVDVGGTFTDFVTREEGGATGTYKSPTTAGDIATGIFNGLDLIASRKGMATKDLLGGCRSFSCGTTVATNAILERKIAKTGLICTDGFRDVLLIREGGKSDTYNIFMDYPEPYLPRYLTFGIRERINAEGRIETPLDEAQVREAIATMKNWGCEAVAVSLLWSIANPVHENRIAEIIEEEWPGIPCSIGHKVNPTIREYRRTSATAIDASLKPIVQRNIDGIRRRLADGGFKGVLTFVTSNGGRTSAADVVGKPVYLCLSGPSAIAQAGMEAARAEGDTRGDIITVDMGGTSFDVSVTTGWSTPMHRQGMIGHELFGVPSVEVLTIGAGGGSIARVDDGGFIHVGPESAGAAPGPACYGRGGTRPTVTDANLVCGLIDPQFFADGQMRLDAAAAETAVRDQVAAPLGIGAHEAASLIRLTIEQNMVGAIEEITVRRGVDPRDFVLVSGGSAAGLHAAAIARELGIRRVIVPRSAGVLAAFGIDRSDIKFNFARSLFATTANFDRAQVNAVLAELEADGTSYLDRMKVAEADRFLEFTVEARYAGQVWQLTLPLSRRRFETDADIAAVVEDFHKLHEHHYSVRAQTDPVEFTEWNLAAGGRTGTSSAGRAAASKRSDKTAATTQRVYLKDAGSVDVPLLRADAMTVGQAVSGPALIQDNLTVILVPSDCRATITIHDNLLLEFDDDE